MSPVSWNFMATTVFGLGIYYLVNSIKKNKTTILISLLKTVSTIKIYVDKWCKPDLKKLKPIYKQLILTGINFHYNQPVLNNRNHNNPLSVLFGNQTKVNLNKQLKILTCYKDKVDCCIKYQFNSEIYYYFPLKAFYPIYINQIPKYINRLETTLQKIKKKQRSHILSCEFTWTSKKSGTIKTIDITNLIYSIQGPFLHTRNIETKLFRDLLNSYYFTVNKNKSPSHYKGSSIVFITNMGDEKKVNLDSSLMIEF